MYIELFWTFNYFYVNRIIIRGNYYILLLLYFIIIIFIIIIFLCCAVSVIGLVAVDSAHKK
jgi:hypothetical protein